METETKTPEPDNTQVVNKSSTPIVEETQEQINWKKFREAREVERKQKEAAERKASEKEAEAAALKAAMDALLSKSTPNYQQSNQNYQTGNTDQEEESEDARIQRKVDAALAERERREIESRSKREQQEFPQRLNSTFNDFHQVCSADNLDYLEYHYPEVASAFRNAPEGYDKWANIYKAVKRFVPNTDSKRESAKADKNFSKPQAMSIAGKTQVGDTAPQNLDDKRRSDNWARMQKVMKGG